jgi:hypothetical protein
MQYYDFRSNWLEFLKAWKQVDYYIELDIAKWKELGLFKNFKLGDPLWKQTRSTYWVIKNTEKANLKIQTEMHIQKYKLTMETQFPYQIRDYKESYYKNCFKYVYEECEPKPDTIDAFYIPEGSYIFRYSIYECARILFPNEEILQLLCNGHVHTVIPRLNIVFNLFEYYENKPLANILNLKI